MIVWYSAEQVYLGRVFRDYALLGDDIVIGDRKVAEAYKHNINELGVSISKAKSLISNIGALEFAKKFRIQDRDLSPLSIRMLRTVVHPIACMAVCKTLGVTQLRVSLRLRGAGYRRYSASPSHFHPKYNRHWYRHLIVAYSPSGICPMPVEYWLSFPEGG